MAHVANMTSTLMLLVCVPAIMFTMAPITDISVNTQQTSRMPSAHPPHSLKILVEALLITSVDADPLAVIEKGIDLHVKVGL